MNIEKRHRLIFLIINAMLEAKIQGIDEMAWKNEQESPYTTESYIKLIKFIYEEL